MDMKIETMIPFRTKETGDTLRIYFAYQYLTITKDDQTFQFVPIESKEIIFNIHTNRIENPNDVFVFQWGNHFLRLSLNKLSFDCDGFVENVYKIAGVNVDKTIIHKCEVPTEIDLLITEFENLNIKHAIDLALDKRDFETARKLVELCN